MLKIWESYFAPLSVSQTKDVNSRQTWKMSDTLPEHDFLFPDFTRKCTNYVSFKIATKQRNLSENTMFTTFTG